MNSCYLIDSSIYIFRYYFSQQNSHESKSGREVSTVLAYFRWLLRFLTKENPDFVAACFDESLGSCFRNEIDPNYKSNRTLPDDELAYQLLSCKRITELSGLSCYASSRFEADDLIASLFDYALSLGHDAVVLTRDKDLGQLLQKESGMFWDYGYDDPIAYDSFTREFGIAPERIPEYLAIAGDSSDAITGVRGVGKKTVASLFEKVGPWETLKRKPEDIAVSGIRGAAGLAKKIDEHKELVDANLRLTTLHRQAIEPEKLDIDRKAPDLNALTSLLDEFQAPDSIFKQLEKLTR